MPCETAMLTEVFTVTPEMSISDALEYMRAKNIRAVPVIDAQRHMVGMLSLSSLLKHLLPVAVTMEDGLRRLDFVIGTAPGVAKRLAKLKQKPVTEVMEKDVVVVHPNTPTWEAIRLMTKYGSPIPVVEEDTGILMGLVSEQLCLIDLERVFDEMDPEDK